MKLEIDMNDLRTLIKNEAKDDKYHNTTQILVSKGSIVNGLEETRKEVVKKYQEALTLWRKSVKVYKNFLGSNPGSKQIRPPSDMPLMPSSYEELLSWKRMIDAFVEDKLYLDISFLKEMFNVRSKVISDIRAVRDSYAVANAGTMSLINEAPPTWK